MRAFKSKNEILLGAGAVISGFSIPTSTAGQNIGFFLLLIAGIISWRQCHEWHKIWRSPFSLAGLSFGVAVIIGSIWSSAAPATALGFIIKLRAYYCIPLMLVCFTKRRARNLFLFSFGAAALLSVSLSCLSAWINYPLVLGEPGDWFVFRTHTYHNFFAALLANCILIVLLIKKPPLNWSIFFITILCLISYDILFLVSGRTGQIAFIFMTSISLLLWNWKIGLPSIVLASLILTALLPNYSTSFNQGVKSAESDLVGFTQGNADTSVGLRLQWYQVSMKLIAERPFFGHGTGSFKTEYERLRQTDTTLISTVNPHNDYLWLSVELGIGGALLLVSLLLASAWQGRHLKPAWRYSLFALMAGMAVSTMANSFFTDNISGLAFVLMTCALLSGPKINNAST